jgi:PAS domain S-box-containing protein
MKGVKTHLRGFRNLSIKWKLMGVLLATSLSGLLLAAIAIGVYEYSRIQHSMVWNLSKQAELVAASSAGATAAGGRQAAEEALKLLRVQPEITDAAIFGPEGKLLAWYARDNSATFDRALSPRAGVGPRFEDGCLLVTQPVRLDNKPVGTVVLRRDLRGEWARARTYCAVGAVALLVAFLLAMRLALRLQGLVSRPILRLNQIACRIAQNHDYSLRATKEYDDELGALVDAFNHMLEQIERRKGELQASERQFRQLTESIQEVFWIVDAKTLLEIYASPAFEKVWGRASAGDWHKQIHPDDRGRVMQAFQTKAVTGGYDEEYRIVRPDGALRWIHARGFPVRDETGDVYRVAGIAEDVTERKQLEVEIIKISDHERARIGQDLHDSICQQLVRCAFSVNLLQKELERREFPAAAAAAAKISTLLNTILKESCQVAHGLCPIQMAGHGLVAALGKLAKEIGHHDQGLACELNCPQPIQIVNQELAIQLFRIAQEAVNNAIKHSAAKRIEIGLEKKAHSLCLWVMDDGVGIAERPAAGRGMGMHIMAYRAQVIGGSLEIRRNDTGGTIARCFVPQAVLDGNNY